jgi:hypothetical protein
MASNNINNHQDYNEDISNISSISTSLNQSTDTSVNDNPRRSLRLSKSPQVNPRSVNQTNLHRTVSGGINSIRSPKLNSRKKGSSSRGRGDYSNALSQTIVDDNRIMLHSTLPSDQSEDDEMLCDLNINQDNNNTIVASDTSKVASRAQILSYFEEKSGGFYCNDCNKVNSLFHFFKYMFAPVKLSRCL